MTLWLFSNGQDPEGVGAMWPDKKAFFTHDQVLPMVGTAFEGHHAMYFGKNKGVVPLFVIPIAEGVFAGGVLAFESESMDEKGDFGP